MRSLKKIVIRLFSFALIAIVSIYIGLFLYSQFGWKNHYSKQQVNILIETVKNTPSLPDSFYVIYDKVFSDRHERITTRYHKSFWAEFFMIKQLPKNNWQLMTARMTEFKGNRYKIAPTTLAFKLNKEIPPEKCFDYVMTKQYSDYSNRFKLNDTISNLKDTNKIIDFLIASKRPYYYRIHPTIFKKETDSLRKLIFARD